MSLNYLTPIGWPRAKSAVCIIDFSSMHLHGSGRVISQALWLQQIQHRSTSSMDRDPSPITKIITFITYSLAVLTSKGFNIDRACGPLV